MIYTEGAEGVYSVNGQRWLIGRTENGPNKGSLYAHLMVFGEWVYYGRRWVAGVLALGDRLPEPEDWVTT